jgi:hypothetical protein
MHREFHVHVRGFEIRLMCESECTVVGILRAFGSLKVNESSPAALCTDGAECEKAISFF